MAIGQLRPKRIREALRKRQREVTALQEQIVTRELTPTQKKVAGKLPQARVVSRIGTGKAATGEVQEVLGRATGVGRAALPKPARVLLWALRAPSEKRTITIALRGKSKEAPLRHELAHQVMSLQDIPAREHHPIIAKARISRKGASLRLLEPTRAAIRFGGTSETKRRRAQLREVKRRVRGKR